MTKADTIGGTGAAKYLSRSELAKRWGISRATTYKMQGDGYLPAPVRLGAGIARFPLAEIERVEKQASEDRGGKS